MKLLLIDGHSLAYRAFYALPSLSNSKGIATQALLGVVNMTFKIIKDEKPTHLIVFFDRETPAFRLNAYPAYKATRKAPPDDFTIQLPFIEEFYSSVLKVPVIAEPGYEADDWIATTVRLAEPEFKEILILSADLDLLQLVSGKTSVLASKRGTSQFIRYTPEEVAGRIGVLPEQITDLKALSGDQSDNIPGIPGLGPKTAAELLKKWGNTEQILEHVEELPEKIKGKVRLLKDQVLLSKELVSLRKDAPLSFNSAMGEIHPFNRKELEEFFLRFDFKKLIDRLGLDSMSVGSEPVPFFRVENQEGLDRMLNVLHQAEEAGILLWPSPSPFLEKQALAVHVPGSGTFLVVNQEYLLQAIRKMLGFSLRGNIFTYNWKAIELAALQEKIPPCSWKIRDVFITGWLCNSSLTNPSLPDLARAYAGIPLPEKASDDPEESASILAQWTFSLCPLGRALDGKMKELNLDPLYEQAELPLIPVLAAMEQTGICLDLPFLEKLAKDLNEDLAGLEGEIYTEAGVIFNLNSSKQLADILYHKLQLPRGRKTKTGYSTDVEELERLAQYSTLPEKLLRYREISKLKGTYVDAFPKLIHPRTGRLHTTYVQPGSVTGRLSSKEPNLQNLPIRTEYGRKVRRAVVPGKAGWKMLSADYSQIELRLLAHFSGDPVLIEAFNNHDDIHARTAGEIFGVSQENVTAEMRRVAKTANFGIIYGMTEHGLSQSLGMKKEDAREYIRKYLERFTKVEAYIEASLEEARKRGMTRTLLGRPRFMPELLSRNSYIRQQAERMGVNAPLQGSAADLIKLAMIRVHERLLREKRESRMVMQVHDELVLEVPGPEEQEIAHLVKEEMEQVAKLQVPLVVDVVSGENWNETQELEF